MIPVLGGEVEVAKSGELDRGRPDLAGLDQQILAELPHGLEAAIARVLVILPFHDHEGLVHQAREEIEVEYQGNDLSARFNAKYLIDVLSRVDAPQFSLELTGPVAPGLLRPLDGRDYLHVVMPVRTPS